MLQDLWRARKINIIIEMLDCSCSLSGTSAFRLCWRPQINRSGKAVPCTLSEPIQYSQSISYARQLPRGALICSAALNAKCAAEQTQTVQGQSTTIMNAPIQGKENLPQLDDGGTGFPPCDDNGNGGGGGSRGLIGQEVFSFLACLHYSASLRTKRERNPIGTAIKDDRGSVLCQNILKRVGDPSLSLYQYHASFSFCCLRENYVSSAGYNTCVHWSWNAGRSYTEMKVGVSSFLLEEVTC